MYEWFLFVGLQIGVLRVGVDRQLHGLVGRPLHLGAPPLCPNLRQSEVRFAASVSRIMVSVLPLHAHGTYVDLFHT